MDRGEMTCVYSAASFNGVNVPSAYLANEEWVFEASKPKHGRVDDDVTRNLQT